MKKMQCYNLMKLKKGTILGIVALLLLAGCNHRQTEEIIDETETAVLEQNLYTDVVDNEESHKFIAIGDGYNDYSELEQLYSVEDIPEKMKEFNQILNDEFDFFEIYTQPLQSKFYWDMEDDFLRVRSDNGEPIKNQRILIDGKECYISSLNTLEVNLNTYNYFLDYIQEGRGFLEEDFHYIQGERIPVILGNDYMQHYSVGDVLELNYLENDLEFEVVGFFEKKLCIEIENSKTDLDTYVCCPFFEIDGKINSDKERNFWLRYYGQKNMGYIKIDVSDIENMSEQQIIEKYRGIIEEESAEIGLEYTVLEFVYNIESN